MTEEEIRKAKERIAKLLKQQWGQDLVLSIDAAGQLHALIEYS